MLQTFMESLILLPAPTSHGQNSCWEAKAAEKKEEELNGGACLGFPPWKLEQLAPAGESPLCILPSLPALLYSEMDRLSVKLEKGCLKNRSVPLMDVGMWAHAI